MTRSTRARLSRAAIVFAVAAATGPLGFAVPAQASSSEHAGSAPTVADHAGHATEVDVRGPWIDVPEGSLVTIPATYCPEEAPKLVRRSFSPTAPPGVEFNAEGRVSYAAAVFAPDDGRGLMGAGGGASWATAFRGDAGRIRLQLHCTDAS